MSGAVIVTGVVRQAEEKVARKTGEVFGTEVSVLTEVGPVLGETLKVMVWASRPGDSREQPEFAVGRKITWIVEVDVDGRYLRATFLRDIAAAGLALVAAIGRAPAAPAAA